MLKIFLVEDEFVVREGIKNNIDWAAHGYEFVGEASDGELAFPMIQKTKPDIVITDIKMPFMDGLTLSRLIKKEFPNMEIIILSGYADFSYAKEGIQIGVAEYLSKPISGQELISVVDKLALKIQEKSKERALKEKYLKEMQENSLQERKNLFHDIITGIIPISEIWDRAGRMGIDLSAISYNILLLKVKSSKHTKEEYSEIVVEVEERISLLNDDLGIISFGRNLEGGVYLFKSDSIENLNKIQKEYVERFENIVEEYENLNYFGGWGVPVNRLSELSYSYEKASRAFAHRYLVEKNCFLDNSDIVSVDSHNEEFNISTVNTKSLDRGKVVEFLKFGEREEVIYFVEEFFKELGSNILNSLMFRQYVAMDTYFCVVEFVEGVGLAKDEIEPIDVNAGMMKSSDATMAYITRIIGKAIDLRDGVSRNKYGDVVETAREFIEQNYMDEELSLNMLASHVNVSPNHLSMVFSQKTGKTFIKYLTDLRMTKAKELLKCTSKRSSEIAMEIGYRDSHYFSYLFKKTQGMTPTKYRGGKETESENNE
ncbi:MAG: response regulator [Agathobacter sp.]|nr:response regulator [Agathobacter sp.]